MRFLLKIKHWQLFILLAVWPVVGQVLFLRNFARTGSFDGAFGTSMLFTAAFAVLFFGWIFTLGANLHRILPPTVRMEPRFFRIALVLPVLYIAVLTILLIIGSESGGAFPGGAWFLLFVVPCHLFSIFCIVYGFYFTAKALRSVEMQREAHFGDYIGVLFLLWFIPVGIWFIPPRVNRLFAPPRIPVVS